MRVIVTGGAGFIGSHMVDAFMGRGDDVLSVDTLSSGHNWLRADLRTATNDVTDAEAMQLLADRFQPELICHMAGHRDVDESITDPYHDAMVNIGGTITMLEVARKVHARLLLCSSIGVLPAPHSPYGAAKLAAEQYVTLYNRMYGSRHAILRPTNVYGPRQSSGVIDAFCKRAQAGQPCLIYGDGGATRDFIYVSDVIGAFLAAAERDMPGVWEVGTCQRTSILHLSRMVGALARHRLEPVFERARRGDIRLSSKPSQAAAIDLGWHATTSLLEGLPVVYDWIESGEAVNEHRPV